jgi:hypothetical protein
MATERTPEDASTAANANPQDSIASLAAPPVAAPVEQRSRWKETVKRRGLMVGVAALIAGAIARRPAQPAEATSGGGPDGLMVLGSNFLTAPNTASQLTILAPSAATFAAPVLFDVEATTSGGGTVNINAIYGNGRGTGAGVIGQAGGTVGQNLGTLANAGVWGNSVSGGTGVLGSSTNGTSDNSVGVYGTSKSSAAGIGVLGLASNDSQSVGVYGQSATGTGFLGFSNATGGVGASAVNSTSGIGLLAQSNGGIAGDFLGNVFITGSLTVLGSFPKSAAVRGRDGNLKRLYCVESPESWFEDFGKGKLKDGSATVQLEPGFAELVKTDDYHVFLTPKGDSEHLYVTGETATTFQVKEARGGTSNIGFSYRLVAKRKDIAGVRLEHVDEPPKRNLPRVPDLPSTLLPQASTPAAAAALTDKPPQPAPPVEVPPGPQVRPGG